MEKYAPNKMELASRDVVVARRGRGDRRGRDIDGFIMLDLRPIGTETIKTNLLQVRELSHGHRRRRPVRRADPHQAHAALLHGRDQGRRRRRARRRPQLVRRRRGQLRQRARRQPAGRQLAARRGSCSAAGREQAAADAAEQSAAAAAFPAAVAGARRGADQDARRPQKGRAPGRHPRRAAAPHVPRRRHLPREGGARRAPSTASRALKERYARVRLARQGQASSTPTCCRRSRPATCSTSPSASPSARSTARRAAAATRARDFPERDDKSWLRHSLFTHSADGARAATTRR